MNSSKQLGKSNELIVKKIVDSGGLIGKQEAENIARAVTSVKSELPSVDPAIPNSACFSEKEYTSISHMGTILLIDDDLIILKLLEHVFTMEGYTVLVCDKPVLAMDLIAASKPDVILLDIVMPNCDGFEILAKIKADPELSDICVVFLSCLDDTEDRIKGIKAGVDDYITKPFDAREVVLRVEMIMRRANKCREKLIKDSLTGAYSRYYFNDRIKDDLERFKRNRTLFSLALVDLDFFKQINDTYGHRTGDFALAEFVTFISEGLRKCDCICRYGGEEFIILMPDTDEERAFAALDRVRQEFSCHLISFGDNSFYVTFSAGIKQVTDGETTASQLINMADKALYFAKSEGRNRVIRYSQMSNKNRPKKTLLLVDDENTVLKLLSDRLAQLGFNIVTASCGHDALDLATRVHPEGVILDILLPDTDGLDICRKLKENPFTRSIKIIILSQKKKEEDIVAGLQCGADDYVVKPFSLAELEARIFRVLSR